MATKDKISNLHNGHRNRMRMQIDNYGVEQLSEHQVLEFLLAYSIPRCDTNTTSHLLINEFGSLANVLDAPIEQLMQIKGVGKVTASFLNHLPQVFKLYSASKPTSKLTLDNSRKAITYAKNILEHLNRESLYGFFMDSNSTLIKTIKLAQGIFNKSNVDIRRITEECIKLNASGIIISHNHPGNDATPSVQDNAFTKNLLISLSLNGFRLLDHIIIAKENNYYSYFCEGALTRYAEEINPTILACVSAPPMKYTKD